MRLRVIVLSLCFISGTTCLGQNLAMQSELSKFEVTLAQHRKAIQDNELQLSLQRLNTTLSKNAPNSPMAQALASQTFAATPPSLDDLVNHLQNITTLLSVGEASVWTGSGVAQVDINFQETTSAWGSDYLRNGFDKAKPYLDWVGDGLIGASLVLNANDANGITTSKRATAFGGTGVILVGSLLQHFLGAKQSNDAAGKVDDLQVNLDQLMMSEDAYNQIQAQYDLVTKYHTASDAEVAKLNDVLTKLGPFTKGTKATPQDLLPIVDELSAVNDAYSSDAKFIDSYIGALIQLYTTYSAAYPPLATKLSAASKSTQQFQQDYDTKIVNGLLRNLPEITSDLQQMRTQLQTQVAQGQE